MQPSSTMADIMPSSSDQHWMQMQLYLHEQIIHGPASETSSFDFSDATIVATTGASDVTGGGGLMMRSSASAGANDNHHHIAPDGKGSTGSKPVRRRSRGSKKTPTTHLNANPTNFRALVQQFTGCPSRSISLKGPLNLDFQLGRVKNHGHEVSKTLTAPPFGNSYDHYYYSQSAHDQMQHLAGELGQQQVRYQVQEQQQYPTVSLDLTVTADHVQPSSISGSNLELEVAADQSFAFVDDISDLHELLGESVSEDNTSDSYFL